MYYFSALFSIQSCRVQYTRVGEEGVAQALKPVMARLYVLPTALRVLATLEVGVATQKLASDKGFNGSLRVSHRKSDHGRPKVLRDLKNRK